MQIPMIFGDQLLFDPFSMLDHRFDMNKNNNVGACNFPMSAQAGFMEDGVHDNGDYGILSEPKNNHNHYNNMGLGSSIRVRSNDIEDNSIPKSHSNHFNNSCFTFTDELHIIQTSKPEDDLFAFGNINHNHNNGELGENLLGDQWDLEGLMQDMSSFPFHDFSKLIE